MPPPGRPNRIRLPLDPVPRAARPDFAAGSHVWDKLFAPRLFISSHNDNGGPGLALEPASGWTILSSPGGNPR